MIGRALDRGAKGVSNALRHRELVPVARELSDLQPLPPGASSRRRQGADQQRDRGAASDALRAHRKWESASKESHLVTRYTASQVRKKSDQVSTPQRSHDFRGGAGRPSMNHPNAAFQSMEIDDGVEPRVVALADHDRSGPSELDHSGGDRFERTEVGAHEDRATTGGERSIDTRESLVGDVDQVERTHPGAAQEQARRQVLSRANETLLRDRLRFEVGQRLLEVVLRGATRLREQSMGQAPCGATELEQRFSRQGVEKRERKTQEQVDDEVFRALKRAPATPVSEIARVFTH
jgi:hypothetical protein